LNTLADRLPAKQLNARLRAPSAWFQIFKSHVDNVRNREAATANAQWSAGGREPRTRPPA